MHFVHRGRIEEREDTDGNGPGEGKEKVEGIEVGEAKREKGGEGDAGANGRGRKKREEGRREGERGVYSLETSQDLAISRHIFRMTSRL